jgi:hypothetical protein
MKYAALVLMLAASAFAQDKPYSLKGFTVGESTLQDFKAQFRHCADNCSDKAVKKYGVPPKFAPFCSGLLRRLPRGKIDSLQRRYQQRLHTSGVGLLSTVLSV